MQHNDFGVLWDMDGVLVDTKELHYQSWLQAMGEFDISFSRQFFIDTFGMNNNGLLALLLGEQPPPDLVEKVASRKEALFRELLPGKVRPLPGVLDWLERLAGWGVSQAIATSAPQANLDAILDELKLRPYFRAMIAGASLPSKPDPAVFLRAAAGIDTPPPRCIVFEDAAAGVEAAKRMGAACIAVTTTSPAEALRAADLVVVRLSDLSEAAFEQVVAERLIVAGDPRC